MRGNRRPCRRGFSGRTVDTVLGVLDGRAYRAAFLPAFLMLFVVAFSLENRPSPATTRLAPEAFSAARTFGTGPAEPPYNSLLELAGSHPERAPGSPGDAAVADRVANAFATDGRFTVRRLRHEADTGRRRVTLETVVGVRPGVSSRRIVVVAHRDAVGRRSLAALSGTAALLELSRIADLRDLRRTLVLVSTSGGTIGGAGARAWAETVGEASQVDGVVVLGDLANANTRRPWIVPWSTDPRPAPLSLRRTLETAARSETGSDPGGARAVVQWMRRAVPLTITEQGPLLAAGLPAVLLQASGERGPRPGDRVSQRTLDGFGRAALRAITALDEAPIPRAGADGAIPPPRQAGTDGIVTLRKVLPTWSVQMAILALTLPALLAAADVWLRARRRGGHPARWLAWAAAGAAPFLVGWAWARLLDLTGVLDAPRGATTAVAVDLGLGGAVAMLSTLIVTGGAWWLLRPVIHRATGTRADSGLDGAAAGTGGVLVGLTLLLALTNPYAAALVVPAAHCWLWLTGAESKPPRWLQVLAVLAGLALPGLAALVYGVTLDMNAVDLAWLLFLAVAGGALSAGTAVAMCLYGASLVSVVMLLVQRHRASAAGVAPTGPGRFARRAPGRLRPAARP